MKLMKTLAIAAALNLTALGAFAGNPVLEDPDADVIAPVVGSLGGGGAAAAAIITALLLIVVIGDDDTAATSTP